MKLAELFVEITGNAKPLSSTLATVQRGLLGTARLATFSGRQLGQSFGPALGQLKGLAGSALLGAGAAAAAGFSAGLYKSIQLAGDFNETVAKTGEVFGASTKVVTDAADQMAEKFGTSKAAFLDSASAIGLIAEGSGLSENAAADLSVQLVKLADDASSFYDTGLDEALEKIRSGLVGESEPLRAFGVLLSEAAVQEEALALGLARSKKEIDENAKFMARASLIQKGLAKAAGDHERTMNSPKNRQRELAGRAENASTSIGQALLPAWSEILNSIQRVEVAASGFLDQHRDQVAAIGRSVSDAVGIMVDRWMELGSALGEFLGTESGQLIRDGLGAALQWLLDLSGAVFDGLVFAMRHWGDISDVVALQIGGALTNIGELTQWLMETFSELLNWFGRNWPQVFQDAFSATLHALSNLQQNLIGFGAAFADWIQSGFTGEFRFNAKPILDGFESSLQELPNIAAPKLTSVADEVDRLWSKMIDDDVARRLKQGQKAVEAVKTETADGAAQAAAAGRGGAAGGGEAGKSFALDAFAKKLQEGALGEDAQKQQLALQRQQLAVSKEQRDLQRQQLQKDDPVAAYS